MKHSGKVQTNDYKNNILVEADISTNTHHSHLDFEVEFEIMSDAEVKEEFEKRQDEILCVWL